MTKRTILKTYSLQRVKETSSLYELNSGGIIKSPSDAGEVFRGVFDMDSMTKEHFVMMSLNTKNKVEALHIVHIGSMNVSVVNSRDVFQMALLDNAASIIVAHNHPSGDTEPSQEDIHVTRRLVEAGKILGIEVLDHIIIGDDSLSLKEKGFV